MLTRAQRGSQNALVSPVGGYSPSSYSATAGTFGQWQMPPNFIPPQPVPVPVQVQQQQVQQQQQHHQGGKESVGPGGGSQGSAGL